MSEQPPPPQVSPDGKFYWDGQDWMPVPPKLFMSTDLRDA